MVTTAVQPRAFSRRPEPQGSSPNRRGIADGAGRALVHGDTLDKVRAATAFRASQRADAQQYAERTVCKAMQSLPGDHIA